jgi:D-alanine transaminase
MARYAYVNGRYVDHREASVHIEDRGYQLADGVYEVVRCAGRQADRRDAAYRPARPLAEGAPDRLAGVAQYAGLHPARTDAAQSRARGAGLHAGDARRRPARPCFSDHAGEASAGHDDQEHQAHRGRGGPPRASSREEHARHPLGARATSRRSRCCRTCSPSRRRARPAPTRPGWSTSKGCVTEGASTNAWIVTDDGELVTRQTDNGILSGITPLRR